LFGYLALPFSLCFGTATLFLLTPAFLFDPLPLTLHFLRKTVPLALSFLLFALTIHLALEVALIGFPLPGNSGVVPSVPITIDIPATKIPAIVAARITRVKLEATTPTAAVVAIASVVIIIAAIIAARIVVVIVVIPTTAATLVAVFPPAIPGVPTGRILLPPVHDDVSLQNVRAAAREAASSELAAVAAETPAAGLPS
jgi:hypothetical protein